MSVSSENSGGVAGGRSAVSPAVPAGDYAPSPNTCSQALARANQLRVQALLRQLLVVHDPQRIDTLRVLRKTLRELDYHLSWLTQLDFLESLERILREENESNADWRLINDATQLLIESIPRLAFDADPQIVGQILASVVQNLGHQRSEVRRSSLLLMNMYINERPAHFQQVLKIFIDYGLANHRNAQAQRGAILSLPLLMTEQVVEGENLLPLIKCLSELLVDADAQLFYSLYLALQRLHLTVGDQQFGAYLRHCDPEATLLYKQAASRNNSLADGPPADAPTEQRAEAGPAVAAATVEERALLRRPSRASEQQQQQQQRQQQQPQAESFGAAQESAAAAEPKQVTFEDDSGSLSAERRGRPHPQQQQQQQLSSSLSSSYESRSLEQPTAAAAAAGRRPSGAATPAPADQSEGSLTAEDEQGERQQPGRRPPGGRRLFQQQRQMIDSSPSSSSDSSASDFSSAVFDRSAATGAAARGGRPPSSVSSTCSSEAKLVDPAHYMTAAALSGRPLADYDQIHHVDHSSTGLAINDMGVCCTPTMELGPAAQNELKFGIFPRHLVSAALSGVQSPVGGGSSAGGSGTAVGAVASNLRQQDRLEALQEMMCIIRDSPINHLAILMTYFDAFLEQFLGRLLSKPGADYKSELIAIDMIETIVIKTKISTIQYIRPMIALLMRTLADSRAIFRDNTIRVIYKMMAFLPPQHVIDAIFEHKHSKSALVREEAVNRVTAAVLEYDKNEFNLTKLCYHVLPMLADHHANVRLAALECIATLANALGQERIGSLLTAAEAVQTGCDYDGLLDAINARLLRRALPRCNPDGSIRYVIKPFLNLANANYHQEHQAADVRWVLEAPSSHQHQHEQHYHAAHSHHHPDHPHHHHHPHHPDHHHQQHQHGASLADLSSLDHHQQQMAHPHRPGVYSPPDASQRRLSSVSLCQLASCNELPGQHRHHHSLSSSQRQQQQQQQQRAGGSGKRLGRGGAAAAEPIEASALAKEEQQQEELQQQQQQQQQRRTSRASAADLRAQELGLAGAKSESQRSRPRTDRSAADDSIGRATTATATATTTTTTPATAIGRRPSAGKGSGGGALRRSNSQDSTSSTDTNKVLFQYYLSKFKQSLTETAANSGAATNSGNSVLPSDSIIYTDSAQAYALGKHQSRYQQTSFDYDPDSVGRLPSAVGPTLGEQQPSGRARRHEPSDQSSSSGSESPLTVMEAAPAGGGGGSGGIRRPQARASVHTAPEGGLAAAARQRKQSLSRASEEQQLEAAARRQSAAQQQQEGAAAQEVGGAECDSQASDSAQRSQQQQRQRSLGSRESPTRAQDEPDQSQPHSHQQHQQLQRAPPKRSLTRQSASVFAPDEGVVGSPQRSSSGSAGQEAGRQEAADEQAAATTRERLQSSGRQESVTTSDSQSSGQRECSDHATQTSARAGSRESRRRRSRRRSSGSKRELLAEQTSGVNEPPNEPPPLAGERAQSRAGRVGEGAGESSSRVELRRRASRSQPPVGKQRSQLGGGGGGGGGSERHTPAATSEQATTASSSGGASLGPPGSGGHRATGQARGGGCRRAVSVSPSVASNVNIRHILENVAEVEGPFPEAQLALKVALSALDNPCWSPKVEGLLALIRLASFHQALVLNHLHEIIGRVVAETRNLRSTVARSAIFVLGDLSAKLKRSIEPELEGIVQALLHKSIENTAFIRDDIRRALGLMVDNLTQWRLANSLIQQGGAHKNMHVRRMASQFVAALVERMGAAKCLVGARDISGQLIPAAAKFAQDSSPHTRYYGRLILARIMQHGAFERLMRKNLTPNLYRSTVGIIESVKRRGAGEPPAD